MRDCVIADIRAMFSFPEAYEVNIDSTNGPMVERPATYRPHFVEFYCVEHDCTFKQWKAVLLHLGEVDQLE